MTARPWPEGTKPTAADLDTWLRRATGDERLAVLDQLLTASEQAERCIIAAHDDELTYLNRALTAALLDADRYRRAWHSARRRAADPNHAADVLERLALTTLEGYPQGPRPAGVEVSTREPGPGFTGQPMTLHTYDEEDPDDR